MTAPEQPFRVTLVLRAPRPAGAGDGAAVERLLEADSPPWRSVAATAQAGRDLALVLAVVERDAPSAAGLAVDGVRARLGLDATFARWVVDARRVHVRSADRPPA